MSLSRNDSEATMQLPLPLERGVDNHNICPIHENRWISVTYPEDLEIDPRVLTRTDTIVLCALDGTLYYTNVLGTAMPYPDTVPEDDINVSDEKCLKNVHPDNIMLEPNGVDFSGPVDTSIYISISKRMFYYNKNGVSLYYYPPVPLENLPLCTCISHNF